MILVNIYNKVAFLAAKNTGGEVSTCMLLPVHKRL
jgi:hypothetical protein